MNREFVAGISALVMRSVNIIIGFCNWTLMFVAGFTVIIVEKNLADGFIKSNLLLIVGSVVLTSVLQYIARTQRANAKIYHGGIRKHDPDSGRLPHYEVILRRNKPNLLVNPWRIFYPMTCDLGKVEVPTGSVSVTPKRMMWLAKTDGVCWNLGSYESLTGDAARRLDEFKNHLDQLETRSTEETDQLETVNKLLAYGMKLEKALVS